MTAFQHWAQVPLLMTVTELEGLVPLSRNTLYVLLESGELPATKVGAKWVISRDAVMRWLEIEEAGEETDRAPNTNVGGSGESVSIFPCAEEVRHEAR